MGTNHPNRSRMKTFKLISVSSGETIDTVSAENPRHARQQLEALHNRRFGDAYALLERVYETAVDKFGRETPVEGWSRCAL